MLELTKEFEEIQAVAESWSLNQTLRWAFDTYGDDVAMASAFGVEGMVLIDHASRIHSGFRLFTIDTEFLFPETYDLMDRVEKRYGIKIEREFPKLNPDEQEAEHGAALWAHNPDLCCAIRKVEPQKRKLAGLRAWISAIRRDQTSTRAKAKRVELDPKADIVKINPMVDWTSDQVWDYVRENGDYHETAAKKELPVGACEEGFVREFPGQGSHDG